LDHPCVIPTAWLGAHAVDLSAEVELVDVLLDSDQDTHATCLQLADVTLAWRTGCAASCPSERHVRFRHSTRTGETCSLLRFGKVTQSLRTPMIVASRRPGNRQTHWKLLRPGGCLLSSVALEPAKRRFWVFSLDPRV
jgi:hypothetical protein